MSSLQGLFLKAAGCSFGRWAGVVGLVGVLSCSMSKMCTLCFEVDRNFVPVSS